MKTKHAFTHLRSKSGWAVRDDVFIDFLGRKGPLTIGFGSPGRTGCELEFGTVIGNRFDAPVLLIKTAWGGRAIAKTFRPPSAGMRDDAAIERELAGLQRRNKAATREDVTKTYGEDYRKMIARVKGVLAKLGTMFPALEGHEPEMKGFVWFQGWNDQYDRCHIEYASNLRHFIRDVRKDFDAPKLPVVVAAMGQNGSKEASGPMKVIQDAQMRVEQLDEFRGNVRSIRTDTLVDTAAEQLFPRWRQEGKAWERTGSDRPYHYYGSAIWFTRIGRAMANAMLDMIDAEVHDLLTRAIVTAQAKAFRDALPLLDAVLEKAPAHREALRWRGHCHTGLAMHAEALKDFNRLIDIDVNNAWTWYARGMAKHNLNQPREAIADYTRALEIDPWHQKALQWRGYNAGSVGDYLGAFADYTKALEGDPKNPWLYHSRARAEFALGSYDRARADFERAAALDPADARNHAQMGYLEVAVGNYEDAVKLLTNAHALDSEEPYVRIWRYWLLEFLGLPSAGARKALPRKKWAGVIAGVLTAKSEPDLYAIEQIIQADPVVMLVPETATQYRCELAFYWGMRHQLAGNKAAAMKKYRDAVILGDATMPEWRAARKLTSK